MEPFGEIPRIEGEHVILREMIAADASALAEIARSEAVYRYLPTFLYEQRYDDAAVAIERMRAECFDTKESILLAVACAKSRSLWINTSSSGAGQTKRSAESTEIEAIWS